MLLATAACDSAARDAEHIRHWSRAGLLGGLEPQERQPLAAAEGSRRRLTVVATGDLKGWLTRSTLYRNMRGERQAGGLAHLAAHIRALRAAEPELILLDGGDALSGAPSATMLGEALGQPTRHFPVVTLMNDLGYDAAALGNQDLALGWASLSHALVQSSFPWLAANLERDGGGTALAPYLILERQGVRVAVLGMTSPSAASGTNPEHLRGLHVGDLVQVAQRWVPFLRQHEAADVVIGLLHSGLNVDYRRETALRGGLPLIAGAGDVADQGMGLDLIISADAHRLSPRDPTDGASAYATPVLEPGGRGNGLALATLLLEGRDGRWRVGTVERRTLPALQEAEPRALAVVAQDLEQTRTLLAGETVLRLRRVPRKSEFYRCAGALSHRVAGYLAADLLAEDVLGGAEGSEARPEQSFSLLPMLWRGLPPGKDELGQRITRAHLQRWLPYGDTLVLRRLTGRQIALLLDGYVRHLRGWRVPDDEVLWPGGLVIEAPEGGSQVTALRPESLVQPGGVSAPLANHDPLPVWLTAYHANGGAGLLPRVLEPVNVRAQDGVETPYTRLTLRAGLFAMLSDQGFEPPAQCARWLEVDGRAGGGRRGDP